MCTEFEKVIFLYFRKKCTKKEIAQLLNLPLLHVNRIIMVEEAEIVNQQKTEKYALKGVSQSQNAIINNE